jgi:hypothetical protein
VLVRLALKIKVPGVGSLTLQPTFSLLDILDNAAVVDAALTTGGYGATAC